MREHEVSPMSPDQLKALREQWQPSGALSADYAAGVVIVAKRRRRVRQMMGVTLLALLTAAPMLWSLREAPAKVADASAPEHVTDAQPPQVVLGEVPAVGSPASQAVDALPQVAEQDGERALREQEPDLVAEAVALQPERAAKSRRHYRESFREFGDDYDGLAEIYFDDSAQ